MTITYLTRGDWGANPLTTIAPQIDPGGVVGLALHHTVMVLPDYDHDRTTAGDLDDISRYMRTLQHARPDLGDDVPYSAVIFRGAGDHDAVVCEGRGYGRRGAHTACNNSTRYGVAYAGNLDIDSWTPGLTAAVRWVGAHWVPAATERTLGHQQFPPCVVDGENLNATACPGRAGLAALASEPLHPPWTEEDDMFTDEDRRTLTFIFDQLRGVSHAGQPRPIREPVGEIARAVARVEAKVGTLDPADIDVSALADALASQLGSEVARQVGEALIRGTNDS